VPGLQDCGAWTEPLELPYYHNLVCQARWDVPLTWSPRMAGSAAAWGLRAATLVPGGREHLLGRHLALTRCSPLKFVCFAFLTD
jgi:hypothetical protein